jgi:predicted regulator of Ras-like GTPase activity (Roadblock/LC7/MglB family)
MIRTLLSELNETDSGVKGSAITSRDGLVLACPAQQKLDEDHVGAMAAALFAVGKQGIAKLVGGEIKQVTVEGEQGHVLVTLPDDDVLLVTVTEAGADVQAVLQQMFRFKEKFTVGLMLSAEEA